MQRADQVCNCKISTRRFEVGRFIFPLQSFVGAPPSATQERDIYPGPWDQGPGGVSSGKRSNSQNLPWTDTHAPAQRSWESDRSECKEGFPAVQSALPPLCQLRHHPGPVTLTMSLGTAAISPLAQRRKHGSEREDLSLQHIGGLRLRTGSERECPGEADPPASGQSWEHM